jgi:hypothetical protein
MSQSLDIKREENDIKCSQLVLSLVNSLRSKESIQLMPKIFTQLSCDYDYDCNESEFITKNEDYNSFTYEEMRYHLISILFNLFITAVYITVMSFALQIYDKKFIFMSIFHIL